MADNEQAGGAFSEEDLISLGKKLATLELTEPERAALAELISDDDVSGFGRARFDIVGGIRLGFRANSGRHGIRAQQRKPLIVDGDFGPATELKPGRF